MDTFERRMDALEQRLSGLELALRSRQETGDGLSSNSIDVDSWNEEMHKLGDVSHF